METFHRNTIGVIKENMGGRRWVNERWEVMAVPLKYYATLGKSLSFLTLTVLICTLRVTPYPTGKVVGQSS